MKKLILIFCLVAFAKALSAQERLSGKVTLVVDFSNVTEMPIYIIVKRFSLGENFLGTDTCKLKGTTLVVEQNIEEPELWTVTAKWKKPGLKAKVFWAVPATYRLIMDRSESFTLDPTYSKTSDSLVALDQRIATFKKEAENIINHMPYEGKKIADAELQLSLLRDSLEFALDRTILYPYLRYNSHTVAGLYALKKYAERPLEFPRRKFKPDSIRLLLSNFEPELLALPSAIELIRQLELAEKLQPGKLLEDIVLTDTNHKNGKVSDYRGNIVLVDFWASWCVYCRQENPSMIRLYQKYKASGLKIISITLDEEPYRKTWYAAISKDGTGIWPQYSDFDKKAIKAYDIKLIPANFLIDREGAIIGKDIRGIKLEEKLRAAFGF